MEHETHVTITQAKLMKRLGFDWKSDHYYFKTHETPSRCFPAENWNASSDERFCSGPTIHVAQKWLREQKGVDIVVIPEFKDNKRVGYDWNIHDDCSGHYALRGTLPFGETYEDALSNGLTAAFEFLDLVEKK